MADLIKKPKKENSDTINLKEINRKELQKQNLIFIISAVMIIIILVVIVGLFINFVIKQINYTFEKDSKAVTNLEGFDLKGFAEIKDKLSEPEGEWENLLETVTTSEELQTSPSSTPTSTIEAETEIVVPSENPEIQTSTEEINESTSTATPTPISTITPTPTSTSTATPPLL